MKVWVLILVYSLMRSPSYFRLGPILLNIRSYLLFKTIKYSFQSSQNLIPPLYITIYISYSNLNDDTNLTVFKH